MEPTEQYFLTYFEDLADYLAFKLTYQVSTMAMLHDRGQLAGTPGFNQVEVKDRNGLLVNVGDRPGRVAEGVSYWGVKSLFWFDSQGEVTHHAHFNMDFLTRPLYWNPVDGHYWVTPGDYVAPAIDDSDED